LPISIDKGFPLPSLAHIRVQTKIELLFKW